MRRSPGDLARRLGTLLVVITAAFASIATSDTPESVYAETEGPRVELTSAEPQVTVPIDVSFSDNSQVIQGQSSWRDWVASRGVSLGDEFITLIRGMPHERNHHIA